MFKVGDKVRVKDDASAWRPAERWIGREVEVYQSYGDYCYVRSDSGECNNIDNTHLELVEPATPAATPPIPDTPTLRDQFAMVAMRAAGTAMTAEQCYAAADAMLAARSKTGGAK